MTGTPARGSETAPSASLSQDQGLLNLRGTAGCSCGPGILGPCRPDCCTCEWGILLSELEDLGYRTTPEDFIREAGELGQEIVALISKRRGELIAVHARQWRGTATSFADHWGVSRSQLRDWKITFPPPPSK